MFSIPKQFSAATRNEFSSQLAAFNTLAGKTMDALEKLVSLNIETARASREEAMNAAKKILSAQTPQQFFSATTERLQANIQTVQTYARHLAEVSAGTQAEFIKVAQLPNAETVKPESLAAPAAPAEPELVKAEPAPPPATEESIAEPAAEIASALAPVPAAIPAVPAAETAEPAAEPEVAKPAAKPEFEAAPEKPAAETTVKKPVTKPHAKAAMAKSSATGSSFPNPTVKSLVKKPLSAKPATAKAQVAGKKLTKPSAKRKP